MAGSPVSGSGRGYTIRRHSTSNFGCSVLQTGVAPLDSLACGKIDWYKLDVLQGLAHGARVPSSFC